MRRITLRTSEECEANDALRPASNFAPIGNHLWRDIRFETAASNVAAIGRMGPIGNLLDQSVFDRIKIAIGDVIGEIGIVADRVFPKARVARKCKTKNCRAQ